MKDLKSISSAKFHLVSWTNPNDSSFNNNNTIKK